MCVRLCSQRIIRFSAILHIFTLALSILSRAFHLSCSPAHPPWASFFPFIFHSTCFFFFISLLCFVALVDDARANHWLVCYYLSLSLWVVFSVPISYRYVYECAACEFHIKFCVGDVAEPGVRQIDYNVHFLRPVHNNDNSHSSPLPLHIRVAIRSR